MIRTLFRWMFRSALVAGAVTLVLRLVRRGYVEPQVDPTASPAPTPPARPSQPEQPAASTSPAGSKTATSEQASSSATATTSAEAWVAPTGDSCPATHPVKVKESSGIFHVPGGLAYDRTSPDRCYVDAAAAEADGFRQAKR